MAPIKKNNSKKNSNSQVKQPNKSRPTPIKKAAVGKIDKPKKVAPDKNTEIQPKKAVKQVLKKATIKKGASKENIENQLTVEKSKAVAKKNTTRSQKKDVQKGAAKNKEKRNAQVKVDQRPEGFSPHEVHPELENLAHIELPFNKKSGNTKKQKKELSKQHSFIANKLQPAPHDPYHGANDPNAQKGVKTPAGKKPLWNSKKNRNGLKKNQSD